MSETDLIDRQAAIDALNGKIKVRKWTNAKVVREAVREYAEMVRDRLEHLPSVELTKEKK